MRMLTASVVLTAVVLLQGCTTLQRYPSFGTSAGGRLIFYDRQGTRNLLPPSRSNLTTHPVSAPDADRIR
jgi:hypothetical protein